MINLRKTTILGEGRRGVSVFRGAGMAIVLLASGCSEDKASALSVPQPDGGVVVVPAMCQVQAQTAAPYAVTFRFRNAGNVALFRYLGCTTELEIASCASSYSDQLASRVFCPCDCAASSCPVCGACYDDGIELAPGATFDDSWTGLVSMRSTSGGRGCETWKAVPAGRYRVRIPFYASATEAKAHAPTAVVVTADFDLPVLTAGGVIDIDINP